MGKTVLTCWLVFMTVIMSVTVYMCYNNYKILKEDGTTQIYTNQWGDVVLEGFIRRKASDAKDTSTDVIYFTGASINGMDKGMVGDNSSGDNSNLLHQ